MECEATLEVGLGDRSYPIWIGVGLLDRIGEALAAVGFPRKVALVTNDRVQPLYGPQVLAALQASGCEVVEIVLPDGEEHKSLATLSTIYDALLAGGIDRGCGLIALGGGVIGDIAGYAAATFLRGIPFLQVPTTLLAQVDSSVGGKTAVNHPLGKNLIGAFYQPRGVLIDVDTLRTLEARDFSAGLAEIIKYGVIRDHDFFRFLQNHISAILAQDRAKLIEIVRISCQIKADIVENDETEQGVRALLNFGHTYGHAVEMLAGYGQFRHGEAVAIGMVVATRIAHDFGLCTMAEVDAIRDLIAACKLPVVGPQWPLDDVVAALSRDKKVKAGILTMVLNHGIGHAEIHRLEDTRTLFERALTA